MQSDDGVLPLCADRCSCLHVLCDGDSWNFVSAVRLCITKSWVVPVLTMQSSGVPINPHPSSSIIIHLGCRISCFHGTTRRRKGNNLIFQPFQVCARHQETVRPRQPATDGPQLQTTRPHVPQFAASYAHLCPYAPAPLPTHAAPGTSG